MAPVDPIQRELARLDGFDLVRLGKSTVTLGGLVTGVLIIVAAVVIAQVLAALIRRWRTRAGESAPQVYIFEKLTTYGLVVIGVIVGVQTVGLDLSSLSLFAGALGVGLGFGLQGVVKEFISGLVLLFDRLVRIGDYIELQSGERGVVEEIGPRATRIRNNDDLNVIIPNSRLIETPFTNWTHDNNTRRVHVPFTVAYGTDKARVRDAVLKAAHDVPFTMPDNDRCKTQVWLVAFGENGMKFELVAWPTLAAVKRPNATQAAYTWAIDDALRAGGFQIPLPQREVRMVEDKVAKPVKAAAPVNDAADDLVRGAQEDAERPAPGVEAKP